MKKETLIHTIKKHKAFHSISMLEAISCNRDKVWTIIFFLCKIFRLIANKIQLSNFQSQWVLVSNYYARDY